MLCATFYKFSLFLICTFGCFNIFWYHCREIFSTWKKYYQLSKVAAVKIRKQRLAVDTLSYVLCAASVRG